MARTWLWGVWAVWLGSWPADAEETNRAQPLARLQLLSELSQQLGQLAVERSTSPSVRALGAQLSEDHHQANRRLAELVLSAKLDLPAPVLTIRQKGRVQWMMQKLAQLRGCRGTDFDLSFLGVVAVIPTLWRDELLTDAGGENTPLPILQTPLRRILETHRRAAEAAAQKLQRSALGGSGTERSCTW